MQPTTDLTSFLKLSEQGDLIPVVCRLRSDVLTPVLAFARLAEAPHAFLLESVTGGEKIGRYSFIGIDPLWLFRSKGPEVELTDCLTGSVQHERCAIPIDRLETLLAAHRPVNIPDLPRFSGGLVGYFGYDVVRQVEHLPNPPARSLGLPDIYVGLYTTMVIFDHVNTTCSVVVHADCRSTPPVDAYTKASATLEDLVARLSAPAALPVESLPPIPSEDPVCESNFAKADFEAAVEACKEYIRAGDIFQVVLSQRFSTPCTTDPFQIYRNIRVINPSPYMFYLKYPEFQLVGASPEVMVRVEDGTITVRPIAGTRRRGKSEEEDLALEQELLADPKERAEHTMLVDLGRNDVGRVAAYGKVRVTEQMVVERYSHVMHIVSNVEGKLQEGLSAFEALKSCLPAGTLSGAPKIRAMEIIDEYEPDVRGPYGGAIGYVDFSGNMDTCITIRTVLLHEGTAYVQAGAGIVADSVPALEYQECQNKARALMKALQIENGGS